MRSRSLHDLARLFLRLGSTAFGGPAAHAGMMEDEVVRRRGWMTREEFLDLLAVCNLIPGPNSTEMAIHIGYRRGGFGGLLVAGTCFLLPAFLIVWVLAWVYANYGRLPLAVDLLAGVTPVVVIIIGQALVRLGQTAIKGPVEFTAGAAAVLLNAWGMHELAVLALIAAAVGFIKTWTHRREPGATLTLFTWAPAWPLAQVAASAPATAASSATLTSLFLFFLKVGSVLYGSGYVLLAFLRADLVERWGWLSERQLLDAVAVGQVTPGPLFTTATFIGYLLAGSKGAILATLGIFLPAFVFVALSAPIVPRLRRSPAAASVLDGLNVASLALMAVVTWRLAAAEFISQAGGPQWRAVAIAGFAAVLLIRYRINTTWLIAGGAIIGAALHVRGGT